jgi:hypothetical protein
MNQSAHRGILAGVLGLTCLALLVRLPGLGRTFWLDEYATAWVVQGPWSEVPARAALNNQPPLYFALTWWVARGVGYHEAGLRLVSLLAGVGLVPATWWLARQLGLTSAGALLSAAMVAVARHCVAMSLEVRPYACVQLLAALQLGLFARLLRHTATPIGMPLERDRACSQSPQTWAWVGWICSSGLLLYLHFLAGLILIPQVAWVLLLGLRTPRSQLWRNSLPWVWAGLAIALLASPLTATFLEVHGHRKMLASWIRNPNLLEWLGAAYSLPLVVAGSLLAWGLDVLDRSTDQHRAEFHQATSDSLGAAALDHSDQERPETSPPSLSRDLTAAQPARESAEVPVADGSSQTSGRTLTHACQSRMQFLLASAFHHQATSWFLLNWIFLPLLVTWGLGYCGIMTVTSPRYLVTMWIAPLLWVAERVTRRTSGKRLWWGVAASVVLILIPSLLKGYHYRPSAPWPELPRLVSLANSPEFQQLPVLYATQLVEAQQLDNDVRPQFREYLASPVSTLHPLSPGRSILPIPDRAWSPTGTTPSQAVALAAAPIRAAGGCLWFGQPLAVDELAELWRRPGEPPLRVEVRPLADLLFHCHITQLAKGTSKPR